MESVAYALWSLLPLLLMLLLGAFALAVAVAFAFAVAVAVAVADAFRMISRGSQWLSEAPRGFQRPEVSGLNSY